MLSKSKKNRTIYIMSNKKGLKPMFKALEDGAGEQIRTVVTSLEGWGSTIELRPQFFVETSA